MGGGNILLTYPSRTYIFRSQRPQTTSLYQNQRSLTCSAINYPVHTAYKLTLSFLFLLSFSFLGVRVSLYSPERCQNHSPPASAIQVLELQECIITPGLVSPLLSVTFF